MSIVNQTKSRPIINENGQKLNDLEFVHFANETIKQYEESTGKACPIDPNFKQFLKECEESCHTPKDVINYKKLHIVQKFDYGQIVENTNKRNAKLKEAI